MCYVFFHSVLLHAWCRVYIFVVVLCSCMCAERRWGPGGGAIWGWYQVDAKFQPALGEVTLLIQFESQNPDSIPSYKANFVLNWQRTTADGVMPSVIAASQNERMQQAIAKGATQPPDGDWVILAEETPRWRGSLVGGRGRGRGRWGHRGRGR